MRRRTVAAVATTVGLLAACSGVAGPDGVGLAEGWSAQVVRDDLVGPTQLAAVPVADVVLVAELGGGEDAGRGRVLDLGEDGARAEPIVMAEGLLTPTGLAADSTEGVVVQEQVEVVDYSDPRSEPLRPDDAVRSVLVGDRPSNGRSQGTLTPVDPDLTGGLVTRLAVATGTGSGPDPAPGSGELYTVTPQEHTIAVGFKNAYAHAFGPDDTLYVTEIGDGRYDGERPPDELYAIPSEVWRAALDGGGEPFDGGWPRCTGDADPTEEFGATAQECAALPAPLALFPPQSTPTSVAVTADGRVLVALWVENRVVEVDPTTGEVTDVATGLDRPQHLLAMADGSVLLTVHGSGQLLRLQPPG